MHFMIGHVLFTRITSFGHSRNILYMYVSHLTQAVMICMYVICLKL